VHVLQYGRRAPQRAAALYAGTARALGCTLGSRPKPNADQTPSHFDRQRPCSVPQKALPLRAGGTAKSSHSVYARSLQHVDYTERKTTCKAPKRQYFLLFFVPFVKILALSPVSMLN
jgi:hypothetical protein